MSFYFVIVPSPFLHRDIRNVATPLPPTYYRNWIRVSSRCMALALIETPLVNSNPSEASKQKVPRGIVGGSFMKIASRAILSMLLVLATIFLANCGGHYF